MKAIKFEAEAYKEFIEWSVNDKKVFKKILEIIKDIERNKNEGIGKPEPLKHELTGWWSRRITEKDRLIYKIENNEIIIANCKGHYK